MRFAFLPLLTLAAPAIAADPVHLAVADTRVDAASGRVTVELIAFNSGDGPAAYRPPAEIAARITPPGGTADVMRLQTMAGQSNSLALAAGAFARLRYEGALPEGVAPGMLSLAIADAAPVALTIPDRGTRVALAAGQPPVASVAPAPPPPAAPPSAGAARDNPFLANLSVYEPTYFVYGPGTNTAGRVQVSLKYQLLGRRGNWLDGVTFAYTQRMFWDLEQDSSPFRDVNYMPELFYLVAPRAVAGDGIQLGGRFGARHESNGRSGDASRSLNTLYVQPEATIPIGSQSLTLGPRLWTYVGGRRGNEDIAHYRGHTGLYMAFGSDTGPRLSLTSRYNIGSGKGAVDAVLSYPLTRIWERGPQFYLIAQGFAGYGEDLLDYNRRQTRARIGIGITR